MLACGIYLFIHLLFIHSGPSGHLASSVDGVGKDSIAVSIVQAVLSIKLLDVIVAIAEIIGAGNLAEVSSLVKDGSGLVLGVARAGQARELVKEEVAVGNGALRGDGVGEDAAAAAVVGVGAEGLRGAAGSRAALVSSLAEDVDNLRADLLRRRLEELLDLVGAAGLGNLRSLVGEADAVGQSLLDGAAAAAGAVALDRRALGQAGVADGSGLGAVDVGLDGVGVVGDRARQLVAGALGVLQDAGRHDVKVAARAQVVGVSNVEGDLDRLASGDLLEVLLLKRLGRHAKAHTLKSGLLAYTLC